MDARFSLLPYSTQLAVEQAGNALHRARRFLHAKQKVADRAAEHGQAAGARAERLQANMRRAEAWSLEVSAAVAWLHLSRYDRRRSRGCPEGAGPTPVP
jgi:hypothetical protein